MSKKVFKNAKIYTPQGILGNGALTVDEHGKIVSIGLDDLQKTDCGEIIDLKDYWLLPGLIDVHIHGGNGFDIMDSTYESMDGISRYHAAHGTTSFLATTRTEDDSDICKALEAAAKAAERGVSGAELLGIHLEGPFINEKRCGAQNKNHIRLPKLEELDKYYQASRGQMRLVTLAPEVEGGLDAVKWFKERNVNVSLGHSDATFEEVIKAVGAGANHTTHHFNGMSPFHHRDLGLSGAGMLLSELTTELIADGIHVHPQVIKFLFQVKGSSNICMVTDAVLCSGLPDGSYGDVIMKNGQVMLADGSSLAGSALTTLHGLINVMKYTGLPLEAVLPSITEVPARQVGVNNRKGSLEQGKDADFIVVNEQLQLFHTFVKGKEVYSCFHDIR